MADHIDEANDLVERWQQAAIAEHRRAIDPGVPGECIECGDYSARLVSGVCAPCREQLERDQARRRQ